MPLPVVVVPAFNLRLRWQSGDVDRATWRRECWRIDARAITTSDPPADPHLPYMAGVLGSRVVEDAHRRGARAGNEKTPHSLGAEKAPFHRVMGAA